MKKVKEVSELENNNKKLELMNESNLKNIEKVVYQGNVTNLDQWNVEFDQNNFFNSDPDKYINVKDSRSLIKFKEVNNFIIINNKLLSV